MARPLRILQPGLWYHVMARGIAGLTLFTNRAEYVHFLDLLSKAHEQFSLEVHAFALMRTHFHLFVRTPLANLSRCMQFLLTSYSVWYNRRHERVGHVLQGRYKALVVERDSYGAEVSRYIHLNPARAMGAQPLDKLRHKARHYPWSSYASYLRLAPQPPFLHVAETLERFGGNSPAGRKAYAQFVEEGLLRDQPDLLSNVHAQTVLGTDTFADMLRRLVVTHGIHDRSAHVTVERLAQVSLENVLDAVVTVTGVPADKIITPRQHNNPDWLLLLWAAWKWCRHSLTLQEIGLRLGGISGPAVCKAAQRFEKQLQRAPRPRHLLAHIRKLEELLAAH